MEVVSRSVSRLLTKLRPAPQFPWPALSRSMRKETRKAMIQPPPVDLFATHTSPGKWRIYQWISLLVGIPLVLAQAVNCLVYGEHHRREPFVPYSYLRLRAKRFPWGDGNHSLFHNPQTNALPDGYETEDHEE